MSLVVNVYDKLWQKRTEYFINNWHSALSVMNCIVMQLYHCYNHTHPFNVCIHSSLKVRFGHPILVMFVSLQRVVCVHRGRLAEPTDLEWHNWLSELTYRTKARKEEKIIFTMWTLTYLMTLLMAQVVSPHLPLSPTPVVVNKYAQFPNWFDDLKLL